LCVCACDSPEPLRPNGSWRSGHRPLGRPLSAADCRHAARPAESVRPLTSAVYEPVCPWSPRSRGLPHESDADRTEAPLRPTATSVVGPRRRPSTRLSPRTSRAGSRLLSRPGHGAATPAHPRYPPPLSRAGGEATTTPPGRGTRRESATTQEKCHVWGDGGRSRKPLSGRKKTREAGPRGSRAAHPSGNAGGSDMDDYVMVEQV
jgi:hypothetical protein